MTTFTVGDKVRLNAENADYWDACGLTGEQVITRIDDGEGMAGFGDNYYGTATFMWRLELVPPAVTIDPAKAYQTRDGRAVRIYAVDGGGDEPVHGAIREGDKWEPTEWSAAGSYIGGGFTTDEDLVEVKPEREGWVNVYSDDCGSLNATKEQADGRAASDRIACLKITFREGDGL